MQTKGAHQKGQIRDMASGMLKVSTPASGCTQQSWRHLGTTVLKSPAMGGYYRIAEKRQAAFGGASISRAAE